MVASPSLFYDEPAPRDRVLPKVAGRALPLADEHAQPGAGGRVVSLLGLSSVVCVRQLMSLYSYRYSYWKGYFPDEVVALSGVSRGFRKGLDLMNQAMALGDDAKYR